MSDDNLNEWLIRLVTPRHIARVDDNARRRRMKRARRKRIRARGWA